MSSTGEQGWAQLQAEGAPLIQATIEHQQNKIRIIRLDMAARNTPEQRTEDEHSIAECNKLIAMLTVEFNRPYPGSATTALVMDEK